MMMMMMMTRHASSNIFSSFSWPQKSVQNGFDSTRIGAHLKVCQPWNSSMQMNQVQFLHPSALHMGYSKFPTEKCDVKLLKKALLLRSRFLRAVCLPTFKKSAKKCIEKMSSSSPPDLSLIFEHLQVSGCPWSLPNNAQGDCLHKAKVFRPTSAWQQLKSSWTMPQIFSRERSSKLFNISWELRKMSRMLQSFIIATAASPFFPIFFSASSITKPLRLQLHLFLPLLQHVLSKKDLEMMISDTSFNLFPNLELTLTKHVGN